MEYKVISNPVDTGKEIRLMIDEMKDKIFDDLFIRVVLNQCEVNELICAIIKEDTQIDLKELDLSIIQEDCVYLDIENDCDLTASEKKYIATTLSKRYGANVLTDMINPVIKQKLNTEHYSLLRDNYGVVVYHMNIDIPMNDFNRKNELCQFLNMIK